MPLSLPPRLGNGAADVQKFNPLGENRLLKRLGADDFARLQPNLKEISLVLGTVLHPAGEPIECQ